MSNRTFAAIAAALASLIASPSPLRADPAITLDARLAQPVMKEGIAHKNYLKVGLTGCRPDPNDNRQPVNVAFVIDRSGSMQGDRITQARAAAIMAINRLKTDDIASVVVFDHRSDVLIPAQQVTNPRFFTDTVQGINIGGSTAIYEGVLRGSDQVLKNKKLGRLNRVVLLSDGQANVGPSRVDDFTKLGALLLQQGVSVSTIGLGLGYNEDLMLELARTSDGNHAFARDPSDLINIFNREFTDVLSSCAQTVSIDIDLKPGVKAVKAISRDGEINGGKAQFKMNQVYAATEHYVLVEVELDPQLAIRGEQDFGIVKVAYSKPGDTARQSLDTPIRGRFTASDDEIKSSIDTKVGEVVLEQVTRARAREAVALRDKGQFDQARSLLLQNAMEINAYSAINPGVMRELFDMGKQYEAMGAAPSNAPAAVMSTQRKQLREMDSNKASSGRRY